jgi:glycosidase
MMEFHIARNARARYQFSDTLFSYAGNVVFANMAACRQFAHRMNLVRDAKNHPELAVHAGQLFAMGLIDEASHVLMARYRQDFDPEVMTSALAWFGAQVGADELDKLLLTFVEHFPGSSVMRGELTPQQWLAGATEGTPHRAAALEELLLLWTANRNEAFRPFEELFEDKTLAEKTVYREVTKQLPEYFATRPLIPVDGATAVSLLDLLRRPAVDSPSSLAEQLDLIRKLWKPLLGESLDRFLLIAGEILHEEELAIWAMYNPPDAEAQARATEAARAAAARRRERGFEQWHEVSSTAEVPIFGQGDARQEYEKFSPDTAWMPTTVLIAKSTFVWLAQLSKQYGRHIGRLDQIPDEELATLAARGMNSLWLIGVWERSRASKTIKQLCGNSDAVASAYSLFDYKISEDLGGEGAYINLRDRCYRHGLRLASDMVPNHMGIDSPWVVEHPEWFISRNESPYPAYSFQGPDLSSDGRVEIRIDDHYFEQTDAAVVFQRRDRYTGDTRYIYHGNDGTSFPWNDTAQLDYLNPAVREQVIQTILYVARLFPVIRFDAAMTLAKQHVQRLWFPAPGDTGSIPSRAESGMSRAEFNKHMPHEFWREVVDRVAAEVPGTLLLAEAFWMLEGYFVRTLGMHRVYNSAFMVMLRDEDNAKYRSVIKNTLEFDPDIMKRYVNFMSNPDERTAIDQFGKGDKCFGVAALMATLPGLPMFGHGQVEGFTEKYGMEYYRPRYDESPDRWLVERHDREIAPLLKRRWLFAESTNFLLYDFFQDSGVVDEHVFAYSNRNGGERALIVYNNRYGATRGTVDYSAAYADKAAGQLRQQRLREGLGLGGDQEAILAFRDSLTGLEYLRRHGQLSNQGLTLDLHAYQCHVFLDWRELRATADKPWDRLCDQLNGAGVPSLDDALVTLELRPVHEALRLELDSTVVRLLADLAEHPRPVSDSAGKREKKPADARLSEERKEFFDLAWRRCESFLRAAQKAYLSLRAQSLAEGEEAAPQPTSPALLSPVFRERLQAAMRIPIIESAFAHPWTAAARRVLPSPSPQFTATAMWGPLLGWCVLELLAESIDAENPEKLALDLFDRLRLREPFAQALMALGFEGEESWRVAARIKVVLLSEAGVGKAKAEPVAAQQVGSAYGLPTQFSPKGDVTELGPSGSLVEVAPQGEPVEPDPANLLSQQDSDPAETAERTVGALDPAGPAAAVAAGAAVPEDAPEPTPFELPPSLWSDPDVRWLTGAHQAGGHSYLVHEPYEELLWWMLMPRLLKLAGEPALDRQAIARMATHVDDALAAAEAAGYRIDRLAGAAVETAEAGMESKDEKAPLDNSGEATAIPSKNRRQKTPVPPR